MVFTPALSWSVALTAPPEPIVRFPPWGAPFTRNIAVGIPALSVTVPFTTICVADVMAETGEMMATGGLGGGGGGGALHDNEIAVEPTVSSLWERAHEL
jgi:hypothetical protein